MATKRITVSVPTEVAARLARAAERTSVSAWVTQAVTRGLAEADVRRQFLEFCDDVQATVVQEAKAVAAFDLVVGGTTARRRRSARRGKRAA
jgi:hypothetical protein